MGSWISDFAENTIYFKKQKQISNEGGGGQYYKWGF